MHGQPWKKEKNPTAPSFVIPKGEKRPLETPVVVKQEPIDLDERAGSFYEQGAMEVPDFFSEAPPPHKKHKHKKEREGGGVSSGASSSGSNPASPTPDFV